MAFNDLVFAFSEAEDPKLAIPIAYLTVATAIRLGDERSASTYFTALRDMGRDLPSDDEAGKLSRWCALGQRLWEDWRQG